MFSNKTVKYIVYTCTKYIAKPVKNFEVGIKSNARVGMRNKYLLILAFKLATYFSECTSSVFLIS